MLDIYTLGEESDESSSEEHESILMPKMGKHFFNLEFLITFIGYANCIDTITYDP